MYIFQKLSKYVSLVCFISLHSNYQMYGDRFKVKFLQCACKYIDTHPPELDSGRRSVARICTPTQI